MFSLRDVVVFIINKGPEEERFLRAWIMDKGRAQLILFYTLKGKFTKYLFFEKMAAFPFRYCKAL